MSSRSKTLRAFFAAATTAALSGTSALARAEPATIAEPAPGSEPTPRADRAGSAETARPPEEDQTPVTVAVIHPLATNADRPNVSTNVDLSILYGRAGRIEGFQLGAGAIHASGNVTGAQIGGVAAHAGGIEGAQLSGVVNITTGEATGAQLAPVNIAGSVSGLQLGIVNVGKKVRGLQLGLVNVAEDVDGGAIGLVSISKNSVHPIAWASNLQYMNVGVKFTTKYLFTALAAHYGTHEADFDAVGATLAIGGHVPLPASFDVELQGSMTQLVSLSEKSKDNSWISPQVAVGYSFAPRVRAFAGGGVRLPISVDIGRDVARPELLAGIQL